MSVAVAFTTTTLIGAVAGFCYGRFSWTVAGVMTGVTLGILYLLAIPIFKQVERWQIERIKYLHGAQSEAFVAWHLQKLPKSWQTFNNLPCSTGGDIDHVVVGPGGLFVISTKSFKGHVTRSANGTLKLNGEPFDAPEEAMKCALWVKDRLKATLGDRVPWVQPVLAMLHAKIDVPSTEGKVWVLGEENFLDTLNPEKPKTKLATSKIELIAGGLERIRA